MEIAALPGHPQFNCSTSTPSLAILFVEDASGKMYLVKGSENGLKVMLEAWWKLKPKDA